ncbi:MAG: peptidoglycan-binding domain-containing protein [Gemmatimonadaceae bacterium]
MHQFNLIRPRMASLAAAAMLASAPAAIAQSRVVLPAGSVVLVRTTTPLQSASAQTGQTFDVTVEEAVGVDEYSVIPAGSHIRGVMSLVRPATRQESGVIDVAFDRLTLSDGSAIAITGKLTSTDSAERRQIEANANSHVALVGGRGGIGAAIAGAGTSRSSTSILSALGGLLSEGRNVDVPTGTLLAVQLERAVALRGRGRLRGAEGSTIYTAAERVSAAQQALAKAGYYRGSITGRLDDLTRRALFSYQVDRGLSGTGNLDGRTAQSLGISLDGGLAGASLSAEQASTVRRSAQSVVARLRADLGSTDIARLNGSRAYAQSDMDLWFALSAFADNASVYEQIVRNGGNRDAAVLAGRALVSAERRVDAALQAARTSSQLQAGWNDVRRQLASIEVPGT